MAGVLDRLEKMSKKQLVTLLYEYSKRKTTEPDISQDIAVVGMSCRLPGSVNTLEDYWQLISNGKVAVIDKPFQRWNIDNYLGAENETGKTYTMSAGLMDNIDRFDADFFQLTPREAQTMDPQQRITLEEIWRALESAGIKPSQCKNKDYGIFLGVAQNEYMNFCREFAEPSDGGYVASGNVQNMIPGRAAYLLGTQGPAMAIDTACSSSLVAVHTAVTNLRQGQCSMAIAGGINVILDPSNMVALAQAKMLSPSGRCHTFDLRADGYVRAEGCGVVILKTLDQAVRDSDNIWAVIKGSAMSHNGRSASITAPSMSAQKRVIESALKDAGLKPEDIDLIEAHGTGTALGDPIELHTLDQTYGKHCKSAKYQVSSVKSNIGHGEAAAGVAGLIKTILCMHHEKIPVQANFDQLNPNVTFQNDALEIPERTKDWPTKQGKKVSAVSSFGFSGVNAHIIVEAFDKANAPCESELSPFLLALSGNSSRALAARVNSYVPFLTEDAEQLQNLCYSNNVHKDHFKFRKVFMGNNVSQLNERLKNSDLKSSQPCGCLERIVIQFSGCSAENFNFIEAAANNNNAFYEQLVQYAAPFEDIVGEPFFVEGGLNRQIIGKGGQYQSAVNLVVSCALLRWLKCFLAEEHLVFDAYGGGVIAAILVSSNLGVKKILSFLLGEKNIDSGRRIEFTQTVLASDERWEAGKTYQEKELLEYISSDKFKAQKQSSSDHKQEIVAFDLDRVKSVDGFLTLLAHCYEQGANVQWQYLYDQSARYISCPLYEFDKVRHWVDGGPVKPSVLLGENRVVEVGDLKLDVQENEGAYRITFDISADSPSLLNDHRLFDKVVVPGSFYMSLAIEFFRREFPNQSIVLDNFSFKSALVLRDDETRKFHLDIQPNQGLYKLLFVSDNGSAVEHCEGAVNISTLQLNSDTINFQEVYDHWSEAKASSEFYKEFAERGYTLGEKFSYIADGWQKNNELLRRVMQSRDTAEFFHWQIDPGMMDSLLQVVGSWPPLRFESNKLFIPFQIRGFQILRDISDVSSFFCHVQIDPSIEPGSSDKILAKLSIYDQSGMLSLVIESFELRAISQATLLNTLESSSPVYIESLELISSFQSFTTSENEFLVIGSDIQEGGDVFDSIQYCQTTQACSNAINDLSSKELSALNFYDAISNLCTQVINTELYVCWVPSAHLLKNELSVIKRLFELLLAMEQCVGDGKSLSLLVILQDYESCAQQAILSVLRCFRWEFQNIECRVAATSANNFQQMVESHRLVEILNQSQVEIYFKENNFFKRKFKRPNPDALQQKTPSTIQGVTQHCLVTGASGGIGEQLTRWLAKQSAVKSITLVGRRQQDESVSALIHSLEDKNIQARYFSVDLSEEHSVDTLIELMAKETIHIDSIFHVAGLLDDDLIQNVNLTSLSAHIHVKYLSLIAMLDKISSVRRLVLFSSLASISGSIGQSVYAAANGLLDGVEKRYPHLDVTSINWGPWKDVGMAARLSDAHQARMLENGLTPISTHYAFKQMQALIESDIRRATLANIDEAAFTQYLPPSEKSLFVESQKSEGQADALLVHKLTSLDSLGRVDELMNFIIETTAKITRAGEEKIRAMNAGFYEIGMDSLMIIEFKKIIETQLDIKLSSSVFFNYPKIDKLVDYLDKKVESKTAEASSVNKSTQKYDQRNNSASRSLDDIAQELEDELEI